MPIFFDVEAIVKLQKLIQQVEKQRRKIFMLCDENTCLYCLSKLENNIPASSFELIVVPAGENSKTIETATKLWEQLLAKEADRKSVLCCLGGGMVTDLGGFAAAVFKRGMDCIFIPTSLMAQVDASIGGKNALNLGYLKNQIGLFNQPKITLIFTQFLQTLPEKEIMSGYAEMLKHGLIADKNYWEHLKNIQDINNLFSAEYIKKSVEIKTAVCAADKKDNNIRKKLNFGHTVGHALEAFFFSVNKPVSHGNAIAMGIIAESHLSWQKGMLDKESFIEIKQLFQKKFSLPKINKSGYRNVMRFMAFDKKRIGENFNFTFLTQIGSADINQQATGKEILDALQFLDYEM